MQTEGPATPSQTADTPATTTASSSSAPASSGASPNVCEGCGREGGAATRCDGNGKIIGGLGAVFAWWPIKAYRPCPDFVKAKKKYRRAGQSLEEIAFGRRGSGDDLSISERLKGK